MSDFTVRSENVDVEQIMRQIRARIREKRGVDYTEDEIRELANVKLEKFIDPKGVRSGLLEEYRRVSTPEPPAPNFAFGEDTLYETHRGPIRWLRALFRPLLKLLFNPNPLIQALHIQAELNTGNAERAARRAQLDSLHYEVIHNLVVELTRTGVEVKSLKMRLESMASRLDFDERRARALEGVVQYRAGAVPPLQPPTTPESGRQDHSRRDQGRRDQGPRNQGPRDQRRDQNQRGRGPSPSPAPNPPAAQSVGTPAVGQYGAAPQAAAAPSGVAAADISTSQGRETDAFAPHGSAPLGQGAQTPGLAGSGNALDADGNERRARRRRRRGRRRPGDREGSPADAGAAASFRPGGAPASAASGSTGDMTGGAAPEPGAAPQAARSEAAGGDGGSFES